MSKKRILILGAGLAGLSVAWHLYRKGIDCLVFEKEKEVGGLCRSKSIDGFTFDCSGHLLHFKHHHTFNLIEGLLGDNLLEHKRRAFVYFNARYIPYPFQANLYGLPSSIIKECLLGFIKVKQNSQLKEKNNLNFLEWIEQTFGKGIAEHFMIPYNTKFWTLAPQRLTCEWLDGFIPIPSLSQIIEGTIEESKRQFGYNAHFWYPKTGSINQLPLALANQIKNIYTNCEITELNLDKKTIKMASGNKESFDYLISTLPLPRLAYIIQGLPSRIRHLFKKLKWNSIFNLNLGIEKKDRYGRHWVYFPEKQTCFFRVGFFNNFSSDHVSLDKTSLYVEVAYSKHKPIDKSKLILHIKEDLKKIGVLKEDDAVCAQDINDIEYAYPIYDRDYSITREEILEFLSKNQVICSGRYGSWQYMSMEDVILQAKEIVNRLYDKFI